MGHIRVVQVLIDAAKQSPAALMLLDRRGPFGMSPLATASRHGYEGIVRLLIAHGAYRHSVDVHGISTLEQGVLSGHLGIVTELLDPHAPTAHVLRSILTAASYGRTAGAVSSTGSDEARVLPLLLNWRAARGSPPPRRKQSGSTAGAADLWESDALAALVWGMVHEDATVAAAKWLAVSPVGARANGVALRMAAALGKDAAVSAFLDRFRQQAHPTNALERNAGALEQQLEAALHVAVMGGHEQAAALLHAQLMASTQARVPAFSETAWSSLQGMQTSDLWRSASAADLGTECDKLAIGHVPRGGGASDGGGDGFVLLRGLVAARTVPAEETVCRVPWTRVLTKTSLVLSSLGEGFMQAYPHLHVTDLAAVFLLRELHREYSPWKPYIHSHLAGDGGVGPLTAPRGIPAAWDPDSDAARLASLSPYARALANSTRRLLHQQYDKTFPDAFGRFAEALSKGGVCRGRGVGRQLQRAVVPTTGGTGANGAGDDAYVCSVESLARIYSRDAFIQANLALSSRSFGMLHTESTGPVWVPWLDMANHPPSARLPLDGTPRHQVCATLSMHYDLDGHEVVLSMDAAAKEGDEICHQYRVIRAGQCGEEQFRNTYGFAPPGLSPCHPEPDTYRSTGKGGESAKS